MSTRLQSISSHCLFADSCDLERSRTVLWTSSPPLGRMSMTPDLITLVGTVRKLIDRSLTDEPQQAQISLVGADHLYEELRAPNVHKWEIGKGVEVTIRPRQQVR